MFNYSLKYTHEFTDEIILTHHKQFSQEQFDTIVKEALTIYNKKVHDVETMAKLLIESHGFKRLEIQAEIEALFSFNELYGVDYEGQKEEESENLHTINIDELKRMFDPSPIKVEYKATPQREKPVK